MTEQQKIDSSGPRRSGRTTDQILTAPDNAIFIWCAFDVTYPKELAHQLGREDLTILGRQTLTTDYFRGKRISGLILDHAIILTDREWENFYTAKLAVRV